MQLPGCILALLLLPTHSDSPHNMPRHCRLHLAWGHLLALLLPGFKAVRIEGAPAADAPAPAKASSAGPAGHDTAQLAAFWTYGVEQSLFTGERRGPDTITGTPGLAWPHAALYGLLHAFPVSHTTSTCNALLSHTCWRLLTPHQHSLLKSPCTMPSQPPSHLPSNTPPLLHPPAGPSHERKYLAFSLFQLLLPHLATADVPAVFSRAFLQCLVNNLRSSDTYLHASAKRCAERLAAHATKAGAGACVCGGEVEGVAVDACMQRGLCGGGGRCCCRCMHAAWPVRVCSVARLHHHTGTWIM